MWRTILVAFCGAFLFAGREDFSQRTIQLENARQQLKKEFDGINEQIDQICDSIRGWYKMPELQSRPVIIPIWGLTGNGKTSVVRRLIELLSFKENYLNYELGNPIGDESFDSETMEVRSVALAEKLEAFHQKPYVVVFDEFQMAKTIDGMGQDMNPVRHDVRDIFQLLGEGYLSIDRRNDIIYAQGELKTILKLKNTEGYFEDSLINTLAKILDREVEELNKQYTKDHKEFARNYLEHLESASNELRLDLTKGLIFVIGNLDAAFRHVDAVDGEVVTADLLAEETQKISREKILSSLQLLFRKEQVARLGSRHIVFRSLTEKAFLAIIRRHLRETVAKVKRIAGIKVSFDPSFAHAVYKEAVIPAKGVRPVLNFMTTVVDSVVADWTSIAVERGAQELNIAIDTQLGRVVGSVVKNGRMVKKLWEKIEFEEALKTQKLAPEPQKTIIAVHEAAHAVVGTMLHRNLPTQIRAASAKDGVGGFVSFKDEANSIDSVDFLFNELTLIMAGRAAEKLVFNLVTVGPQSDLVAATAIASAMVREFGMGGHIAKSSVARDPMAMVGTEAEDNTHIDKWINEAEKRATNLLVQEKSLFVALSDKLRRQPSVTPSEFLEMIEVHVSDENKNVISHLKKKKVDNSCARAFERFKRKA